MQNKMIKWSLPGVMALSLVACGGSSSHFGEGTANSPGFSPNTSSDANNSDNSDHAPTININIYNGSWATSPQCAYNSNSSQGISSFWDFQGGYGIFNNNTYSTSDCSGNYDSLRLGYNFQYGNVLPNASSVCANVVEVTMTLVSATSNGQSIPLSQLDPSIQVRQYNLMCTNNNYLYFGDTRSDSFYNGSSINRRPLSLDQDYPFLRL